MGNQCAKYEHPRSRNEMPYEPRDRLFLQILSICDIYMGLQGHVGYLNFLLLFKSHR